MGPTRLMLAGGGDEHDSQPLDQHFARWVGEQGRLLYLPIAGEPPGQDYTSHLEWLEGVFRPLDVVDITMWTDLRDHDPNELEDYTALYIGGGNTFRLLHELRTAAFEAPLRRFSERGGALYGGSAGAILLGRDIGTCAHMDENRVGLTDTRGLDLVQGHAIWCHYQPADDVRIREYCRTHHTPMLALSERAGVRVEGTQLAAGGYEPVLCFDATGMQVGELPRCEAEQSP